MPLGVVTLIFPLVAPAGTLVLIMVGDKTLNVASVPLNATEWTPLKSVPRIVTAVPTPPLNGVKEEITGGGADLAPNPLIEKLTVIQTKRISPNVK